MNTIPSFTRSFARRTQILILKPSPCSPSRTKPSSTLPGRTFGTTRISAKNQTIKISSTYTPSNRPATEATAKSNSPQNPHKLDPRSKKQSPPSPLDASTSESATIPEHPADIPISSQLQPPVSTESSTLRVATVTRANTMKNCVRVTLNEQLYSPHIRKHYTRPHSLLVHDPNPAGFLREGDVVQFGRFSPAEIAARVANQEKYEKIALETVGKVRRNGREVMRLVKGRVKVTGEDGRGKHGGTKDVKKWKGPRWVVKDVVTPFGESVEERLKAVA